MADHPFWDSVANNAIKPQSGRLRRNYTASGRAAGAAELQSLVASIAWKWNENAEQNTAQNVLRIRLNDTWADVPL